ncbi:MAG: hypothetical protein JXR94_23030 [Candidatus Hydrogenedentes bacterium]|nr:hypothetical protein [Candidatus Hydrogenedentota bacterium]
MSCLGRCILIGLLLLVCIPVALSVILSVASIAVPSVAHSYGEAITDLTGLQRNSAFLIPAFGLSLAPFLFLILVIYALVRLLKSEAPTSREKADMNADESRMIQELYNGFSRMEDRIEALETILIDRQRAGRR